MTDSFYPPQRTLMGPGPSDVNPRVLAAMARPTIGHLDPEFIRMMDETRELLQATFKTQNALTLPISAPGSAGMEACFGNLTEPGDTVIVCVNGVFGNRMVENVERMGGTAVRVDDEWGTPIDPAKLEAALAKHPDTKIVAMVHAETSTGVRSDVESLAKIAHDRDCLVIVDTVTSFAGIELEVDEWGLDAVYSGSQKCLSCAPGLSPVTFGPRAVEVIQNRKSRIQSWFLDMNLIMGYWGDGSSTNGSGRSYHHTAPINSLYGLHESLVVLHEEGLDKAIQRHRNNHLALRAGLEAIGLHLLVEEPYRLPQLNTVVIPKGVNDVHVRTRLLEDHNVEIGAGLGALAGKVWRIGLMGHGSNPTNVYRCLGCLEGLLETSGAVAAARAAYK